MKRHADQKNHAKHANIQTGDYVLAKQRKENKLSTPFKPTPMVVTETKGSMITACPTHGDPVSLTRNSSRFRKLKHGQPQYYSILEPCESDMTPHDMDEIPQFAELSPKNLSVPHTPAKAKIQNPSSPVQTPTHTPTTPCVPTQISPSHAQANITCSPKHLSDTARRIERPSRIKKPLPS